MLFSETHSRYLRELCSQRLVTRTRHGWSTTLLANTARRFIAAVCRWPELVASFVSICHHLRRVALPSSFNDWSLILLCTAVLPGINHCITLYLNVSHCVSLYHTVSHCITCPTLVLERFDRKKAIPKTHICELLFPFRFASESSYQKISDTPE